MQAGERAPLVGGNTSEGLSEIALGRANGPLFAGKMCVNAHLRNEFVPKGGQSGETGLS
jgi:hypothetical protein